MTSLPQHRDQLGEWLNEHGLTGSMAEIGCAFGGFSKTMLSRWRGKRYLMIDPWTVQDASVYKEKQEEAWKYERWFVECSDIAERDKRVEIMRNYSHVASSHIQDGSLDCCYIDGNHSFDAVTQDLYDWWAKVKSGGLICGHDFYDETRAEGYWNEVASAVLRWAHRHSLGVFTTPCSSWWIEKT